MSTTSSRRPDQSPQAAVPPVATAYRLGVLGAGRVFEHLHLPALRGHPRWRVSVVHDPVPGRVALAQASFPEALAAPDPDTLLRSPGLDAVLVLTPPETHASLSVQAFERGLAALIEKPLSCSVEDAEAVVAAWRRSGRPALVGFNRRHRAPYRALRAAACSSGIRSVEFALIADRGRWDRAAASEDLLHDLASHGLDLAAWIARQPLREVSVMEGAVAGGGAGVIIDGRLEGGVRAQLQVGRGARYAEWLAVRSDAGRLLAHAGGLVPGWMAPSRARYWLAAAGAVTDPIVARLRGRATATRGSLLRQLDDLANLLDGAPGTGGADPIDGLRVVQAVDACVTSLASGGARVDVARPGSPDTCHTSRVETR